MPNTAAAFFVAEGGRFRATELTRGPWSPDFQHAGPPSALLARAIELAVAATPMAVARLTIELMRPVPIAVFAVRTQVQRAGKKVQWLSAELVAADDTVLARAHALCIRTTQVPLPIAGAANLDALPGPAQSTPFQFPFFTSAVGYHTAMEARLARGTFGSGAVAMWMRMRHPLVAGEAPSPLQRVMTAADSGNGVSAVLDVKRYTFVNPELTVHLHRMPAGDWVCLDARTIPQGNGVGLAETRLLDEKGAIGRSAQSLLIEARAG